MRLVQSNKGNREDAENSLNEALKICGFLAGREPSLYDRELAMILNNLGSIQEEKEHSTTQNNISMKR
jgi:hypothetical protein